jgi:hypothetical protein
MNTGATRRSLLQMLGAAGGLGTMMAELADADPVDAQPVDPPNTDPHTKLVFSAAADQIVERYFTD